MDHWTGALLLERALTVMSAGFNAMHFARELWRLRGGNKPPSRRRQPVRAALVAMVVINAALAAGALHPLAASRFAWAARSAGLEAVAVGTSLTAALLMTALVMRERK